MSFRPLLLLAILASGCHATFKKYASTVGTARVQVITTGGPFVQLGYTDNQSLIGAVVNVTQAVKSINQTERIENAVHPPDIQSSVAQGIVDTLGSGPPFAVTMDPSVKPVLQLEILSYGMAVPYLGAPGRFTFTARAHVYLANGKRIYTNNLTCDTGVGDPNTLAAVLGTVNNVKQLKEMTDQQINDTFVAVAHYCGNLFTTQIRKHAG